MSGRTPVTQEQFFSAMEACGAAAADAVAAAVSGGGDSMALALLLSVWARDNGRRFLALTVDHGLRAEAAAEAAAVHDFFASRGLEHRILPWEGEKPAARVQEAARAARYRLLLEACRAAGVGVLAVAHNREDQAETFWMRLAHGSGLDGLAGMARMREERGVRIVRPLLSFSRAQLRDTCAAAGVAWAEDPSNTQEKYLRPRLRAFEELLAGEGLSPERLEKTCARLEEARMALEATAEKALARHALFHAAGYVTIDRDGWTGEPADIRRRVVAAVLRAFSPAECYAAPMEGVEDLAAAMTGEGFGGRTFHGCEVSPFRGKRFLVTREGAALPAPLPLQDGMVWDARFRLQVAGVSDDSFRLGGLGEEGVSVLRKNAEKGSPLFLAMEGIPYRALCTLPAVWKGLKPVIVQPLGYVDTGGAAAEAGVTFFPLWPVKIV